MIITQKNNKTIINNDMKPIDYILNNEKEVLEFLKSHYPMYHLSNIFFRDIQYGIRTMLERRGQKVGYMEAENIARKFAEKLEKEKIFTPIDRQSWVLNYPAFKKPAVVQATPAKPAPGAAPAKSPAAAKPAAAVSGARPPLPPLGSAKPAGTASAAGTPSKLPPLTSAKPASGLPPLTSAKPAGAATPGLPPITSAKPTDGQPARSIQQATAPEPTPAVEQSPERAEPKAEESAAPVRSTVTAPEKPAVPQVQQPAVTSAGEKRTLPPLKGNYKPAGKK